MKIFVAGATGVVGRRAVDRLIEAGHDVTGVARSPAKAAQLRRQGATPVTVDLFDAAAVKEAVAGHQVVINLATHIPPMSQAALPRAWAENDRIRTEVSRNLVDAALAAGSARYIQESISFLYEDAGDGWVTEQSPMQVPAYTRSTQVAEAEAARFAGEGGVGVVLRFALFYGPDSHGTLDMLRLAAHRLPPAPGAAASFISSIATDDAATAVVAALAVPSGTYNVADDEPVTRGEFGGVVATALGVRPPRQGLSVMARAAGSKTELLMRSQRVANGAFREASGWAPAFPSVREGLPATVAAVRASDSSFARPSGAARVVRVGLAFLAASAAMLGVWALAAPRNFYDTFPGGRGWVAADGPYNEHLLRDFGGLNLGLTVILVVAAVKLTPLLARTAAVASLAFGVPHLVYHLAHLDTYEGIDKVGNAATLSGGVLVGILVLVLAGRMNPDAGEARA